MKNCSFKGINESYDPSISWNKNKFSIIAELQASPLTGSIILHLKGSKWTLQKRKTDVGMQQNYSRCSDHFARNTALGRLSDVGKNFHFLQNLPRIHVKLFKLQFLEIPSSVFYFYMSEKMPYLEILWGGYTWMLHTTYLIKGPKIIKFHHFGIDPSCKNQPLWIKWAYRFSLWMHQTLDFEYTHTKTYIYIYIHSEFNIRWAVML